MNFISLQQKHESFIQELIAKQLSEEQTCKTGIESNSKWTSLYYHVLLLPKFDILSGNSGMANANINTDLEMEINLDILMYCNSPSKILELKLNEFFKISNLT